MKKLLLVALSLLIVSNVMAEDKKLTAVFSYATFALSHGSPYVETYLSFDAWNMNFIKNKQGQYQATVEVVMMALKNDSVAYVKKYDLNSPAINDTVNNHFNFMDVQRFPLKNGIYTLKIVMRDKMSKREPVEVNQKLVVDHSAVKPNLSSLQTMSIATPTTKENILSRNGYDMEPYINDFYPEQLKTINFYCEIYNIKNEIGKKDFLTTSFIEQQETGQRYEPSVSIKTHTGADLIPIYASIDISELPSGNYNLVFEVRNIQNDMMLFRKVPFIRSNPSIKEAKIASSAATFAGQITDENMLNYYLDALYPIARHDEETIAAELSKTPGKMSEKQDFFYNFWAKRNPLDPEGEWRKYRTMLDYVAANFSFPKIPGYKTDRGRVYLQYGPPNHIRDEKNFVSTRYLGHGNTYQEKELSGKTQTSQGHIYYLPYQLWRYNELPGDDINRVFLFWDEFRSGYYKLLNSNAKGELHEIQWERRLSQQQLNEDVAGEVSEQFDRGY